MPILHTMPPSWMASISSSESGRRGRGFSIRVVALLFALVAAGVVAVGALASVFWYTLDAASFAGTTFTEPLCVLRAA